MKNLLNKILPRKQYLVTYVYYKGNVEGTGYVKGKTGYFFDISEIIQDVKEYIKKDMIDRPIITALTIY
jgi:hypothetical protein